MTEFGLDREGRVYISPRIAIAAGSVLLVAAHFTAPSQQVRPAFPITEQQVLDQMKNGSISNKVWNGAVVLSHNTPIYNEPFGHKPRGRHLVDDMTTLITERPRLFRDRDGDTWLGMVTAGKGATSGQATDASRTHWVRAKDVVNTPGNQPLAYENYNPSDNNGLDIPKTIAVSVTNENNLSTPGKDGGIPYQALATVSALPTSLLDQEVKRHGLVPSNMDPNLAG